MLKVVMEINEIVVLEKDNRPVRKNSLSAFLSGVVSIPEEFEDVFMKFLRDTRNRNLMNLLLKEEQKKKNLEYIKNCKKEILKNWIEL